MNDHNEHSPRPRIYFTVHDWMLTHLGIRDPFLTTFAFAYNYSLLGASVFDWEVAKMFHIAERTARDRLRHLYKMGVLERRWTGVQGQSKYAYRVPLAKVHSKAFKP